MHTMYFRLEDLFYAMGVDLVIEAHEHSYERLWPVYHSDVIQHSYLHPRAPVHIISGAGGNSEGVDLTGFSSMLYFEFIIICWIPFFLDLGCTVETLMRIKNFLYGDRENH